MKGAENMAMTFDEFCREIDMTFRKKMGEDAQVCIQTIYKNNNLKRQALCILEHGSNAAPTIYLEPYYDLLLDGTEMNEITKQILKDYEGSRCHAYINMMEFEDFELARGQIVFRLVNYEENSTLLKDVPYRRFLDLAVVYYYEIRNSFLGRGTTIIHLGQMRRWKVTEEDLYESALKNMERLMGSEILPVEQIIRQLLQKDLAEHMEVGPRDPERVHQEAGDIAGQILDCMAPDRQQEMYVMTNRERSYGASTLLYRERLRKFAEEHGDLYVIPSSVHEVILLPCSDQLSGEDLRELLTDVNSSMLSQEEYLSDHIYIYRADTDDFILHGEEQAVAD